jgi:hypothetical protein
MTTFYVKDTSQKLVQAQFLQYNGNYVTDPNTSQVQSIQIFDANGNPIANANPNGYLIVPADYSIANVTSGPAATVQSLMQAATLSGGMVVFGAAAFEAAMTLMTSDFIPGGPQDLQRTYDGQSGLPFVGATDVPAFRDAASFNLGLFAAYAGIPLDLAEFGGGIFNEGNSLLRQLEGKSPLNTSGPILNADVNGNSISAGFSFGQTLTGATFASADPSNVQLDSSSGGDVANVSWLNDNQMVVSQNFASGISQTDTYTFNPDTSFSEAITGYSQPNLQGSQIYQQTTNVSATGAITSDISGSGDVTTLDNAAITIENTTTATINGTTNTITVGSSDNITLAADPSNASSGTNDTVNAASGANLTTDTLNFDGNSIATNIVSGQADAYGRTYTLSGSTLTIASGSDTLTIDGFATGDFGIDTFEAIADPSATSSTQVAAINNSGEVVGYYSANGSSTSNVGFIDNNGTYTSIPSPSSQQVNFTPTSINNNGVVAGYSMNSSTDQNSGFVDNAGSFTSIIDPNEGNGGSTYVNAINDSGVTAGYYSVVNNGILGGTYGFIDNEGVFTNVSDPNANTAQNLSTEVTGINNSGVMVGYYFAPSSTQKQGFIDDNGVFTTINDPNGTSGTMLTGINNEGEITGDYFHNVKLPNQRLPTSVTQGFTYENGVFTSTGYPDTQALTSNIDGINDNGEIVGSNTANGDFEGTPFLPVDLSGTQNATNVNDTPIVVAANSQSTVAGSYNSISLAGNDALTLAAGSQNNTLTANGTGNAANFTAADTGIAGETTALSNGVLQANFPDPEAVIVNAGSEIAISGTDGTMTADNNSTGNGVISNTINWNAGGSEIQTFTTASGSTTETDTSYSGANGTGTQLWQQLTTTASNDSITSTISGTGDAAQLSNAAITLSANSSAALAGNNNTVTVGSHATMTEDAGSSGNSYTLSGTVGDVSITGSNEVVNINGFDNASGDSTTSSGNSFIFGGGGEDWISLGGSHDTATISSSSDTVYIAGEPYGVVAGQTITLDSNSDEQIRLATSANGSGGDVITVNKGFQMGILGWDGTFSANDNASGNGVIQNILNAKAGWSEVENLTLNPDGSTTETDLGYSGTNGTGTQNWQQVTTTAADGSITSTISGTGAISGLSNATITMDDSTTATLVDGSGNTVALGSNDVLALGNELSDTITVSGDNSNVSDDANSSNNTYNLNGNSDGVTVSGNSDTVTLTGTNDGVGTGNSDDNFTLSGSSDTGWITGNNITNLVEGDSDTETLTGNNETINVTGTGDTINELTYTSDNDITFNGNSGSAILHGGGGDQVTLNGSNDYTLAMGNDTITEAGSSNWIDLYGTDSAITASGTGNTLNETASSGGNTIILNGTSDSALLGFAGGDDITFNGSGNYGKIYGGNTIALAGSSNYIDLYGSNSTITISGTGDTLNETVSSGGNTIILNGSSEGFTTAGAEGDTLALNGSDDSVGIQSDGSNVNVGGTSNTAYIASGVTSGTASISGTNALVDIAGTSSENITFDTGALGLLKLHNASSYSGTVAGLASGDGIDLANFQFSNGSSITGVTGTGAVGTATDITISNNGVNTTLALLNQYASQFSTNASAYTLTADSTAANAGTLLQLAAGH